MRTEEVYLRWIMEFLRWIKVQHGEWRHLRGWGSPDVNAYLTDLAVERQVAARTQNQALSAILFLYRDVLQREIATETVRAQRPERLPLVWRVDEVRGLLQAIPPGAFRIMAGLMYGAGMRLLTVRRLRVKHAALMVAARSGRATVALYLTRTSSAERL